MIFIYNIVNIVRQGPVYSYLIMKKIAPKSDSPFEKEVKRLHANGKPLDIIALRLGAKMSRVLAVLNAPALTTT